VENAREARGYITLTYQFFKEGRRWVGVCDELGTSTFSRSLDKVEKELTEAVNLHLNTLEDVGECARFFREHNIIVHEVKPKPAIIEIPYSGRDDVYFRPHIQPLPMHSRC
jgi:hypothetical protein